MIQIKFHIQSNNLVKNKKIQFCRNHEKNLDILYGITLESIKRDKKSDWEQLMMICCFHIVREIRENKIVDTIQEKLYDELTKHHGIMHILKDIKKISIDAKIDSFPRKVLGLTHE